MSLSDEDRALREQRRARRTQRARRSAMRRMERNAPHIERVLSQHQPATAYELQELARIPYEEVRGALNWLKSQNRADWYPDPYPLDGDRQRGYRRLWRLLDAD